MCSIALNAISRMQQWNTLDWNSRHNNASDRSRSTDAILAGCSLRDILSRSNTCALFCGSVNLVVLPLEIDP